MVDLRGQQGGISVLTVIVLLRVMIFITLIIKKLV
jgi:hypothetical protein